MIDKKKLIEWVTEHAETHTVPLVAARADTSLPTHDKILDLLGLYRDDGTWKEISEAEARARMKGVS